MKIVCLVVLFGVAVQAQLPGNPRCPNNPGFGACVIGPDYCTTDDDCPKNNYSGSVCCPNGCGPACVKPKQFGRPRDGTCPQLPSRIVSFCASYTDACYEDQDCTGQTVKCCEGPCGMVCVDPDSSAPEPEPPLEKPGGCPVLPVGVAMICTPADECTNDNDCGSSTQKCCTGFCGTKCKEAVNVKPGDCPKTTSPFAPVCQSYSNTCSEDDECGTNQKCCIGPCGVQCMDPAGAPQPEPQPEPEGGCPVLPVGVAARCPHADECTNDNDCGSSTEKCCKTLCGRKCTAAVNVKPGDCPKTASPFAALCQSYSNTCSEDDECGTNQKCCRGPCGTQCMDPAGAPQPEPEEPVTNPPSNEENPNCPRSAEPFFGPCVIDEYYCTSDAECVQNGYVNHICCRQGCGPRCVPMPKDNSKPGPRPSPPLLKPGSCPDAPPKQSFCLFYKSTCTNDGSCYGDQKCCKGSCGPECMDPETNTEPEPQPIEPAPRPENPNCAKSTDFSVGICVIGEDYCTSDEQCAEKGFVGHICCSQGCGPKCVPEVKDNEKPGTCPIDYTLPFILCAANTPNLCNNDYDCTGQDKCCTKGCRKECLSAETSGSPRPLETSKPGSCAPPNPILQYICGLSPNIRASFNDLNECKNDYECDDNLKCCDSGCSSSCRRPRGRF